MKKLALIILALFALKTTLSAQEADSTKGAELYSLGSTLRKEGKLDEALDAYDKALDAFTKQNVEAYGTTLYQIGFIYDKSNRDKTAASYYEQGLEFANQLIESSQDYTLAKSILLQLGFAYLYIDEREKVSVTMNRLLKLTTLDTAKASQYQAYSHNLLASNYQYLGKWDSAAFHAKQALAAGQLLGEDLIQVKGETYNCNAELNYNLGNYKEAQFYLNKQLELYRSALGDFHPYTSRPIMQLGIIAFGASNYADAVDYFKQALDLSRLNGDSTSYTYASLAINASGLYEILGEDDLAIAYLEQAIQIYESVESGQANTYENFAIMAHLQSKVNAYDKSLDYAEKAAPLFDMESDKNNLKQGAARKLAKSYAAMSAFGTAEKYAALSLRLVKQLNITGTELPYAYLTVAQIYLDQQKGALAMSYVDSADMANKHEGVYKNKDVAVETSRLMMRAMRQTINGYSAQELYTQITWRDSLISSFKINIDSELGESFESHSFYDEALGLVYDASELFKEEKFLNLFVALSDRNRSNALKDLIGKAEFYESIELGDGILEKKKRLISELSILKKQVSSTSDKAKISELNIQYEATKKEFDQLKSEIQNDFPLYHEYNYAVKALNINELRQKLRVQEETLISYYLDDESLYIFAGSKEFFIHKIPWHSSYDSLIVSLRNKLKDPNSSIAHESTKLYELLIAPIEASVTTKRIRIINHGVLSYIPFEVLMEKNDQYLFEKFDLTYAYSAGTYLINSGQRAGQQMLAYAPLFENQGLGDEVRASIGYLPGTRLEIEAIDDHIEGEFVSGIEASETNFKINAGKFEMLHLATHAIVDDRSPDFSKLLFNTEEDSVNDGNLHSYEILGMDLRAKLVTLSACNTGFGKIQKGEGVMSLSRAFAYAGVPSTVVSLWPASDKSTPELMKYFYQNLKEGQTKDVALNNARKKYLATAKGKASHPFYWGGFVLIGDNSSIEEDTNLLVYLVPVTLIIVMILTLYRRKKAKV